MRDANITLTNSKYFNQQQIPGSIQGRWFHTKYFLASPCQVVFVCLFVCLFFFEGVGENVLCDNSDCYAKCSFPSSEKVARF